MHNYLFTALKYSMYLHYFLSEKELQKSCFFHYIKLHTIKQSSFLLYLLSYISNIELISYISLSSISYVILRFSKDFVNQNWENTFDYLTLPDSIINAEEIEFYLEVIPGSAEYNLDNVTLEIVNEETWEQEANERIEILRKRNVTIYLDSDDLFTNDPTQGYRNRFNLIDSLSEM